MNDDSFAHGVENDLRRVVKVQFLHQVGAMGFDGREADALKIGRPTRTNALQVLKRGGQRRRRDSIQC